MKAKTGRAITIIVNMLATIKFATFKEEDISKFLKHNKQLIVNCKQPSIKKRKKELYINISSSNYSVFFNILCLFFKGWRIINKNINMIISPKIETYQLEFFKKL